MRMCTYCDMTLLTFRFDNLGITTRYSGSWLNHKLLRNAYSCGPSPVFFNGFPGGARFQPEHDA